MRIEDQEDVDAMKIAEQEQHDVDDEDLNEFNNMGEDANAQTVASGDHTHGDETVNNEGQEDSIVD